MYILFIVVVNKKFQPELKKYIMLKKKVLFSSCLQIQSKLKEKMVGLNLWNV